MSIYTALTVILNIILIFAQGILPEHFTFQIIMEFKTTLEIVTKDIQDIEKLVGNFKNYSRIPNIELDLALSRLRNVYDLLLMFKADATPHAATEDVGRIEQPDKKQEVAVPVTMNAPVTPEPLTPREETRPAIVTEVLEVPVSQIPSKVGIVSENIPVAPVRNAPVTHAVEKPVAQVKPAEEKLFVNEKLGEKNVRKDIASKLQGQAIKSIAGSIGINDKFFFIRELFAGSAETFRLTMEELDEARNFNEAHSLIMDRFQWDMDSEPVQMLLNLIRRKFIPAGNE